MEEDKLIKRYSIGAFGGMEQEAVAWILTGIDGRKFIECNKTVVEMFSCFVGNKVEPLYAEPHPVPVSVPTFDEWCERTENKPVGWVRDAMREAYDACRAAMLQAGNSPVVQDDVRRMNWLVSKTVDVREPMVYGSHSLFWSQTITDEEDDYHATKLREQIDAAMAAEQAASPQQE